MEVLTPTLLSAPVASPGLASGISNFSLVRLLRLQKGEMQQRQPEWPVMDEGNIKILTSFGFGNY